MNQIASIQNTPKQIERLAAQRELYTSAKRYYIVQLWGSIFIPIIASLFAIYYDKISAFVGLYGICFLILDILVIERIITERRTKAAKIQELFDCDVLELKKSPLKIVDDIAVEEVLTHYNAFQKAQKDISKIQDWYPKETAVLEITYARLICQKTNCWWDSKLRTNYSNLLRLVSILLGLSLIVYGFIESLKLEQIVLIASGLIPFFQFSAKQYLDNTESSERLTRVNQYISAIWDDIIKGCIDKPAVEEASRRIQDEFYENRIRSPLILDSFYWIFRSNNEGLMSRTAETLIEELQAANIS
jgi:hypothetical protein